MGIGIDPKVHLGRELAQAGNAFAGANGIDFATGQHPVVYAQLIHIAVEPERRTGIGIPPDRKWFDISIQQDSAGR